MTYEEATHQLDLLCAYDIPTLKEAVRVAKAALRAQAEAEQNEPLTVEELREMDGEPVYDWRHCEWFVISEVTDDEVIMTDGTVYDINEDSINTAVGAVYRRKPEEGTK